MESTRVEMTKAMNEAGYVAEIGEYVTAMDAGDRWVFVVEGDEEIFTVGEFFKATATKRADFAGKPFMESDDGVEACCSAISLVESLRVQGQ